jgi:hypothetical protein
MTKKARETCGATVEVGEDAELLTCDLEPGHDGPVHSDKGHAWGDFTLPAPHHVEV